MDKELLDMPLNCRGSLVLSPASVHLQLERPREVGVDDGDDHDVPGVAVVKFEACGFTCEGLISSEWTISIMYVHIIWLYEWQTMKMRKKATFFSNLNLFFLVYVEIPGKNEQR